MQYTSHIKYIVCINNKDKKKSQIIHGIIKNIKSKTVIYNN